MESETGRISCGPGTILSAPAGFVSGIPTILSGPDRTLSGLKQALSHAETIVFAGERGLFAAQRILSAGETTVDALPAVQVVRPTNSKNFVISQRLATELFTMPVDCIIGGISPRRL